MPVAPKPSATRRRRNKTADVLELPPVPQPDEGTLDWLIAQPLVIPKVPERDAESVLQAPDTYWHPIAVELWESFSRSGQAKTWEPSDWAMAKLFCESLSRDLQPQVVGISTPNEFNPEAEVVREKIPLKGASLAAYLKFGGNLLLTAGDRARLRLELEPKRAAAAPDEGKSAKVIPITDRRQALLINAAGAS